MAEILFHELENRAEAWHVARFGRAMPIASDTFEKLLEEVGELGAAIMRGDPDSVEHEIGDVVHVLMHLARIGYGPGRLLVPTLKAIERCEARLQANHDAQDAGEGR